MMQTVVDLTHTHTALSLSLAIKYYAKLILTQSEANLPLNVTYTVLRSLN